MSNRPAITAKEGIQHAPLNQEHPPAPDHRHAGTPGPLPERDDGFLSGRIETAVPRGFLKREEWAVRIAERIGWSELHEATAVDTSDSSGTPVADSILSAKGSAGWRWPDVSSDM